MSSDRILLIGAKGQLGETFSKHFMDSSFSQRYELTRIDIKELNFLFRDVIPKKLSELSLLDYYRDIELPMVFVLANMEYNGTYVDMGILSDMSNKTNRNNPTIILRAFCWSTDFECVLG